MRLETREEIQLDRQIFDDRLDNPIGAPGFRQFVEAADTNQVEDVAMIERIRFEHPQPLSSLRGRLCGNVEQLHRQTGVAR